ncbi:MAG: C25 family cysteine peptidase, partial [Candidatus Bathyarchaeia archaeon]
NYHYMIMRPPPNPPTRVNGSLSITVNFQNLIVEAQPKFLKWDRSYPQNDDTTISFSLHSAQKKNCNVTVEIYPVDGGSPIFTTQIPVICPGSATFQWDGTMNTGGVLPGTQAPTGIYTFDITAVGACPDDQDKMRSFNLSISNVAVESLGLSAIREGKFSLSYTLNDISNIAPLSTSYSVFSPWLMELKSGSASNLLGANSQESNDVNLETAGYHTFVVSSVCSNLNNKSHSPHPALDKGTKFRVAPAVCFGFAWPTCGDATIAYRHLGKVLHTDGLSSCYSEVRPNPQTGERRGGVIIGGKVNQALESIKENAVFEFSGHGNSQALQFSDGQLRVKQINDLPAGSLSHLVFALFNACEAGQTFCDEVVNKGAEAALGFKEEIGMGVGSTWERAFWKYATKEGMSVKSSAGKALEETSKKLWYRIPPFPNQINVLKRSMYIVGDTPLYPARKGKILR